MSSDSLPDESVSFDELRHDICAIGVVGKIDCHEVIRRGSVIDIIEARAASAAMSSDADEREAFKRWAVKCHGPDTLSDPDAGSMWSAWKARSAVPSSHVSGEYERGYEHGHADATRQAITGSTYTYAVGDAGQRYMARFEHAHPLPALFRWQELWDAMSSAAAVHHEAPEPNHPKAESILREALARLPDELIDREISALTEDGEELTASDLRAFARRIEEAARSALAGMPEQQQPDAPTKGAR
jgi:hypothetical protein